MSRLRFPKEILDAIKAQAQAAWPEEVCGLLSGVQGRGVPEAMSLHQMDNVIGRYHSEDPDAWPRDARSGWLMDPRIFRDLKRHLDRAETPILCLYHSHTRSDARLSEEDRRMALHEGRPLHPGVEHLVLSVREDRVVGIRAYLWKDGRFQGRDVRLRGE